MKKLFWLLLFSIFALHSVGQADVVARSLKINGNIVYPNFKGTISQLRAATTTYDTYFTTDDGKTGYWFYDFRDSSSADNGGTIIVTANNRRIKRIFTGPINIEWFGANGKDTLNDSQATQAAIDYVHSKGGGTVLIPEGIFRISVTVKSGVTITAPQAARRNWMGTLPTNIRPPSGATAIFTFPDTCNNAKLEHLYIDGRAFNGVQLPVAINFNGYNNNLIDNTVVNITGIAVKIGIAQLAKIVDNNFQGFNSIPTLTGFTGGGIHVSTIIFDSDIIGNEIGAGSNYATFKDTGRRAVAAYFANISTCNVRDNFFENGDKGCYINIGDYCTFSGNRYEVNAGEGLEIYNHHQSTFVGERFTNNSSAGEGLYDHLVIGFDCYGLRFVNPNFTLLDIAGTGNRKARHAISNKRPYWYLPNEVHSPFFIETAYTQSAINTDAGYYKPNLTVEIANGEIEPFKVRGFTSMGNIDLETNNFIGPYPTLRDSLGRASYPDYGLTFGFPDDTIRLQGILSGYSGLNFMVGHQRHLELSGDGTSAFLGTVSGATPTATNHFTTKAYVDNSAASVHTAAPSVSGSGILLSGKIVLGTNLTDEYWEVKIDGVTKYIPVFSTLP